MDLIRKNIGPANLLFVIGVNIDGRFTQVVVADRMAADAHEDIIFPTDGTAEIIQNPGTPKHEDVLAIFVGPMAKVNAGKFVATLIAEDIT